MMLMMGLEGMATPVLRCFLYWQSPHCGSTAYMSRPGTPFGIAWGLDSPSATRMFITSIALALNVQRDALPSIFKPFGEHIRTSLLRCGRSCIHWRNASQPCRHPLGGVCLLASTHRGRACWRAKCTAANGARVASLAGPGASSPRRWVGDSGLFSRVCAARHARWSAGGECAFVRIIGSLGTGRVGSSRRRG